MVAARFRAKIILHGGHLQTRYGYFIATLLSGLLSACGVQKTTDVLSVAPGYPTQPANLKLFMTEKPINNAAEVKVSVDRIEIILERGGKQARLTIARDLELIFRNGVLLGVSEIDIPEQISIRQIRMILKDSGHQLVHSDSSTCDLKTPSAQHSGIKILLKSPIEFESRKSYAMVVDFDLAKSVVQQGNGRCLLKPVVKLISATRENSGPVNTVEAPDTLADGSDGNDTTTDDGFDTTAPNHLPPTIDEDFLVSYFF